MNYLVFDLETTGIGIYGRKPNALYEGQRIIAAAYKNSNVAECIYDIDGLHEQDIMPIFKDINLVVGHNLKYDLEFLWKWPSFQTWLLAGGRCWCTMLTEYILTAHETTMPSLDDLSEKYGGTLKSLPMKELFELGFGAEKADRDELVAYAKQDVLNTERVFLAQLKEAKKEGMLKCILAENRHLLCLIEMEVNGLYCDRPKILMLSEQYRARVRQIEEEMHRCVKDVWDFPGELNYNSPKQLAALLYGGTLPHIKEVPLCDEDGQQLMWKSGPKSGLLRTTKETSKVVVQGFGIPNRTRSTDKTTVENLAMWAKRVDNKLLLPFFYLLLEYRTTSKYLKTYLYNAEEIKNSKGKIKREESGLYPFIYQEDGCIHSNLHNCITKTGRVNSRTPNIQNLAGDLLEVFVSRYGEGGVLIEADVSQLEVIAQAYLSQSERFIQDIKKGVDFHCLRLSYAEGMPYEEVYHKSVTQALPEWQEKRSKAKVISFQKAYGAHPEKIALLAKLPVQIVEKIFSAEDTLYPEIEQFYQTVRDSIKITSKNTGKLISIRIKNQGPGPEKEITKIGENLHVGYWSNIFGRKYHFNESAVLTSRGVFHYYKDTYTKNYPVQGLAAVIVGTLVGEFFTGWGMFNRDKCLIVNEVHDSLILDCRQEHKDLVISKLKAIFSDIGEIFFKRFGVHFNVPFKIEAKAGKTWAAVKKGETGCD